MKKWVVLFLLAAVAPGRAMFMMPEWIPAERVVSNLQARVAANPGDAEAHFSLARAHYLAFAFGMNAVPANEYSGKLNVAPQWMLGGDPTYHLRQAEARRRAGDDTRDPGYWKKVQAIAAQLVKEGWTPARADLDSRKKHAEAALGAFQEALRLAPENGLYELGLASLIAQWNEWSGSNKVASTQFKGMDSAAAAKHFLRAYKLAIGADLKNKYQPASGFGSLVSYEAGQALLRMTEKNTNLIPESEATGIRSGVAKIKKLPMGPITPLIVPLGPAESIRELIDDAARVEFDLSGMGLGRVWPWLRGDRAGFLIWQSPYGEPVVSGRQMFGGYTFRLFWRDGFDALASLDDNGDGIISGAEREGLKVWFDRNNNGRSEPDELVALDDMGIVSLATATTDRESGHPVHRAGIKLRDGTTRALWDWMPQPVE